MELSNSVVRKFLELDSIKHLNKMLGEGTAPVFISPLFGSSKSLLLLKLIENEKQILVLLPEIKSIEEFQVELDILNLSSNVIAITEFKPEFLQEKLTEISKKDKLILLADYNILNCEFPSKEKIDRSTTKISAGGELNYNEIIEYLNLLNYQKDKFVEAPGDYSLRGSIIDFWSYSEKNPVRLEFDGDFLESIRYFDPESQRSIDNAEVVTLAGSLVNQQGDETSDIFSYLKSPLVIASSYELHSFHTSKFNCFKQQEDEVAIIQEEAVPEVPVENEFPDIVITDIPEEINPHLENNIKFIINSENKRWLIEEELGSSDKRIDIGFSDSPVINSNYEILFNILQNYSADKYKIIITSENDLQSERLKELLSQFRQDLATLIETGKVRIETLAIKKGFVSKKEKFLLLTDYEIFNKPYRTKIIKSHKYKKSKSKAFASIKKGDYVVHEDYGIGRYTGLETIKIGEANQESMKILYNEGGVVYVNLNYLTLVKKYSSNDALVPTLSTLGTGDWASTKQKTKKKIKEAARELIELYAKRKATKGYAFNPDTVWQKELEASFFYEDTPDQTKVTEEIKQDMEAESPMDRLVCGDVGFGKTEVAVRAAFKAVQDNKQVALLVPTTILAEQHYNTFKDRLSQFPVKVAVISRFQTRKQQLEILKDLEQGRVDILIGTHRLLSKDVSFRDLGILIIDEEHRFGVMAKEKLRSIKANVDTLTLTATPIPRTLNLSLLGARDLSIIATPPPNRQPIYTTVSVFDIAKIKDWIMHELQRSGQVYFVHDRVQSIDKLAGYLHKYLPDLKVAIAHGQMKPAQLEEVIHGFLNRKFDVLLSTKIIESGIDIPNVNTIIVNRADRFGLAELHQLRGRVGRSNKQAYSYFIVPSLHGISKKALRRLQAIEEFTDVGTGFNISMRDLEIRGAGNLLGTEQTGFINDVGFDLYVKMINEAVEELKYLEFKEIFKDLPKTEEKSEPTIDTFYDIGIPQEYMPEQMDRLNFYTALYSINNVAEIDDLRDEIIDRFGPLPIIVKRLIAAATLKFYASRSLFDRIIIQRKYIFIILPNEKKEEYYSVKFIELMRFILDHYKDSIKFSQQKDVLKLVITNNFETPDKISEFLIKFSREIMKLFNNEPVQLPALSLN
ncbi:MAG: transcription-repair coupling factor [Ignavibacteriaceae bacterium]|nr:transcription-repair coupling factor [Ignavibacteriaceae bacterium]